MNFENDPIAYKVELSMIYLKSKGISFIDSTQYNKVFEYFYELHKKTNDLENKLKQLKTTI